VVTDSALLTYLVVLVFNTSITRHIAAARCVVEGVGELN